MIDDLDICLLAVIQDGLPLTSRPYASIGEQLGIGEPEVLSRLANLKQQGIVKRLAVIVQHRQLGYRANAMVVFDIPDADVDSLGQQISRFDFVNLCYQRPRHADWPYNLYCMIHGKSRSTVLQQLKQLIAVCNIADYRYEVLFSRRCFKQRGAIYSRLDENQLTAPLPN